MCICMHVGIYVFMSYQWGWGAKENIKLSRKCAVMVINEISGFLAL